MNATPQSAWASACHQLEMQLDRASFETWFRAARLMGVEATPADMPMPPGLPAHTVLGRERFIIGVPTVIARDMLAHRYYRNLRRVVGDAYGQVVELRFEVAAVPETVKEADETLPLFQALARAEQLPPLTSDGGMAVPAASEPLHRHVARPRQPDLPQSELNPRFTFARFLPGNENAMVYAAAVSVAESPAQMYNPFYIYGGVGVGKTHLLHAIAHTCTARGQRAVYISSEMFTNDLVESIRQKTMPMFREKYRSADVLLVDDVQFISGKESTQEEFFHTFEALHRAGKQIVLASDRPPAALTTLTDRLRSRFQAGLVTDVHMPEFETRVAILRGWAADRGIELETAVLETLAERAKANIRELEGLFVGLVASMRFSVSRGQQPRKVAIEPVILRDAMDNYERPRYSVTVGDVIAATAAVHGLTAADLVGSRRTNRINEARQIAMYLARELTTVSLPQIGEAFGGRKHSTVHHALGSMAAALPHDERLSAIVASVRARLIRPEGAS